MGQMENHHVTDFEAEQEDFEGLETDDFPAAAEASRPGKIGEAMRTGGFRYHRLWQILFRLIVVMLAAYGVYRLFT